MSLALIKIILSRPTRKCVYEFATRYELKMLVKDMIFFINEEV